ncbi:MAG: hypothetical protein FJW38_21095, partial [Acidobacteria bacterium]|nr:hypothetical protein [Acidobacteriota bacterium]
MGRLTAFWILAALPALPQTPAYFWYEQTPQLARGGQPVKLRIRADGVTRFVFEPAEGGANRDFSNIGAGLFEVEFTAPPYEPRHLNLRRVGGARSFGNAGATGLLNIAIRYAENLPPVRLTPLAADAQRSDYIINIHSKAFYDGMVTNGMHVFTAEPLARRMYELLADDFDFVNIVVGNVSNIANRYHGTIRNSISGIGISNTLNNGASWGSARRLQGFTMYPNIAFFDNAESGFLHEKGHQWISAIPNAPFVIGRPHWPISSMAAGVMGFSDPFNRQGLGFPCRFTPQADGSIAVSSGSPLTNRFGDFDLYLIGLLDPSEIRDPQYLITDNAKLQAATTNSCPGAGTLTPAQYQRVTIQDLITAAGGARQLSAAASQKDFRTVNLVVSRDGLLSPDEMAYFEQMARRGEERNLVPSSGSQPGTYVPWFTATRERSTMSTKISSLPMPVISTGGVVNAASFVGASLGPGAVASIFGTSLALSTASASSVPLPATLGGVRVIVNGRAAPLFYVSPGQINFQLPDDLSTRAVINGDPAGFASVRVERDGMSSNHGYVDIRPFGTGIITYGDNYAVAVKADNSVIGPSNPAVGGETITIYWVGTATLTETVAAGTPAPLDRLIRVSGPTNVSLGGLSHLVTFSGLTPGGV